MLKKALITSCILLLASTANAEGFFIGGSTGLTDIDVPGFDDGISIAITGGYKVNKNFSLETSYLDLGESEDDIVPVWTIEVSGINLSAVGILPANDKLDIFGKVGIFIWDVTLDEAGTGEIDSDDGTDISLGFGAAINITDQFTLLAEYQKFDLDGDDVTNISIGGRMNF